MGSQIQETHGAPICICIGLHPTFNVLCEIGLVVTWKEYFVADTMAYLRNYDE
jgi:hypothetical protein